MKQRLETLLAAVRHLDVPIEDDGFAARVMSRIGAQNQVPGWEGQEMIVYPRPPRRILYRVPTLATAVASVVLLTVIYFTGYDTLSLWQEAKARGVAYWEQVAWAPQPIK